MTVKWIWMAIVFCVLLISITLLTKVLTADLDYQSQASVTIKSSPEKVFMMVGNLTKWPEWSPFIPANAPRIQLDQTASPPMMTWNDPRGGQSTLTLDRLDAVAGEVDQTLKSAIFPEMKGKFEIEPAGQDLVTVTWKVEGRLPNTFFYALAAGNYGEMMQTQLEQSLNRLKTVCEKEKIPAKENTPENVGADSQSQ